MASPHQPLVDDGNDSTGVDKNALDAPKSKKHQGRTIGRYQLGDSIGKGAFGVVYKGLDVERGGFVAVKSIPLHGIPKSEIEGIMMEIKLLKNLDHENIVTYHDYIRGGKDLFIIMEFLENGSLAHVVKKFGFLPEGVVALYIAQALEGLGYLHEQGVVHRDIKGANILITKSGKVKLADFGVATKLSEADAEEPGVVGTPYWMAPEVIEMSGPSSPASDIWSIGCTIIELLTGSPPYFDLAPMPALFRIVQDTCPPLPEAISPALRDFLSRVFQKDPTLRISAPAARKHVENDGEDDENVPDVVKGTLNNFRSSQKLDELIGKPPTLKKMKSKELVLPPAKKSVTMAEDEDDEDWGDIEEGLEAKLKQVKTPRLIRQEDITVQLVGSQSSPAKKLDRFREGNDENYDNFFDEEDPFEDMEKEAEEPDFASKLDNVFKKQWDQEVDAVDPFAEDFDIDDDDWLKTAEKREQEIRHSQEILKLIGSLQPAQREDVILDACQRLVTLFKEYPQQKRVLIANHGVIPIMEMLYVDNPMVLHGILQVVNQIIEANREFQENLCLVGIIPIVMKFTESTRSFKIRVEAASFVQKMCHSSTLTLQMFIACQGLPVLVGFLDGDYATNKELKFIAIDGIVQIFKLQTPTPRNDFCRLFSQAGLWPLLFDLIGAAHRDQDDEAAAVAIGKCAEIFLIFSAADTPVKVLMCQEANLDLLVPLLGQLEPEALLRIIKGLKQLSMDPSTLLAMQKSGIVTELVKMLDRQNVDSENELHNQAVGALFNLCKVNRKRQEQAAVAGIVPHLQKYIENNSPLRQFALQIYCDLARANKKCRAELKKYGGVEFYIGLLKLPYWQVNALESLAHWLHEDGSIEDVLLKPANIKSLITTFTSATDKGLVQIVEPFLKILNTSRNVNQHFGEKSSKFVSNVISRLQHENPHARLALVKILASLYEFAKNPKLLIAENKLHSVFNRVKSKDPAVMVRELAIELWDAFSANRVL